MDASPAHTATDDRSSAARRVVARSALFGVLSAGAPAGVLLVCGPPGSGKTVLLRSWAESLGGRVAWISVERGEEEAQHFWLAVVDAVAGAVGDGPSSAWAPPRRSAAMPSSSACCRSCARSPSHSSWSSTTSMSCGPPTRCACSSAS
jgi:hypothetical protein